MLQFSLHILLMTLLKQCEGLYIPVESDTDDHRIPALPNQWSQMNVILFAELCSGYSLEPRNRMNAIIRISQTPCTVEKY